MLPDMSKAVFQSNRKNVALVLSPDLSFSHEEREFPTTPASNCVVVRILATGICGSDIHYWKHGAIGNIRVTKPIVLGHESAGVVVQRGRRVTSIKEGDYVALEPGVPCRICKVCRGGRYNLCPDMRFAATPPFDGTLTTYYTAPEDFCFKLPESVSVEEGALLEPLSVAVHCAHLANIRPENSVLVLGAGPIGLICSSVARVFGASTVIVTDVVPDRLRFAETYAAAVTYLVNDKLSYEEQSEAILLSAELPQGVDICIDATGVESSIKTGVAALTRGGTFVQVGLRKPEIAYPVGLLCSKEAVYKGSFRYAAGDYQLALQLVESGRVDLKALITSRYAFEHAQQAFEGVAAQQGIKTIIFGPGVPDAQSKL